MINLVLPPTSAVNMTRKVDWEEEEESGEEEDSASDEERDDEEPRIKDVLENLSNAVSKQEASDLLHSMASSKDILFWTPSGLLLRNQRMIPVTNIAELVDNVLHPHNADVTKPRALKTFIDGLAELGIDKHLIKNKKILIDLLEKGKAYRDQDKSDSGASDEETMSKAADNEGGTKTTSKMGDEMEYENSGNSNQAEIDDFEEITTDDSKNVAQIFLKSKFLCNYCNGSNVYQTAVVRCPICFWHDGYKICPVCEHDIPVHERKYSNMDLFDALIVTRRNILTQRLPKKRTIHLAMKRIDFLIN